MAMALAVLIIVINLTNADENTTCNDPLEEIVKAMSCIEAEDIACVVDSYAPDFVKMHNGKVTDTPITKDFWSGTFMLVDIAMYYDIQENVAINQASLRYTETVTTTDGSDLGLPASNDFPWNQTFVQNEEALITVDDNCKMRLWDQHGDEAEQREVERAADEILCSVGFYTGSRCDEKEATAMPEEVVESVASSDAELKETTELESYPTESQKGLEPLEQGPSGVASTLATAASKSASDGPLKPSPNIIN
ncbi:hypothetical protein THAOC_10656 [Thalassiosira oceanica]|uniref:Secreted protein n=1 Tax=Thalassiosira oceanica TaxID=159749 RepID=K0TCL1_THAOC|nr:hypothetical protein THAOC_10656 [Thalassiosira oceanica]|eukprot:EJK68187.1 hypothetical protein THAOC_10656 [Thalassiosira oceanica]